MRNLINFNCDKELMGAVDVVVSNSESKYKDRTQFMILAIREKLEKENQKS